MKNYTFLSALLIFPALTACNITESTPDGASLFSSNCATCHGSTAGGGQGPNIRGKSATQINSAINNVGRMNFLQGKFSSDEISAIADHLAKLNSSNKPDVKKANLIGSIEPYLSIDGIVELKDNSGIYLTQETLDGDFNFKLFGLTPPYLVKYTDNTGRILFGASNGQEDSITVSPDSNTILTGNVDANLLFDSCGEYRDACYNDTTFLNTIEKLNIEK